MQRCHTSAICKIYDCKFQHAILFFEITSIRVCQKGDGVQDNILCIKDLNVNSLYVLHLLDHIYLASFRFNKPKRSSFSSRFKVYGRFKVFH